MTSKDQSTNSELREAIEDLIVDTKLHPVEASLRIMRLLTSHTKSAVIAELEGFQHGGTISQYSIKKRIADIKADKEKS